jgi:hypothetical protein
MAEGESDIDVRAVVRQLVTESLEQEGIGPTPRLSLSVRVLLSQHRPPPVGATERERAPRAAIPALRIPLCFGGEGRRHLAVVPNSAERCRYRPRYGGTATNLSARP